MNLENSKRHVGMMEPVSLRYFCEVAKQGSLRGAARRLFVAQSAVSRQITSLEESLGVLLFDRHARGMSLTAVGQLLLAFADETHERFEIFRSQIHDFESLRRGHLDIASVEGVLPGVLLIFTERLLADFPGLSLSIAAMGSRAVGEAVAQHQVDLGLVFGSSPRSDLLEIASMAQPLCAIVNADHPLAEKRKCTLSDIAPYPVMLPDRSFGIRQLIDRACATQHLRFHTVIETNTLAFAWRLAQHTGSVTFLPVDSVRNEVDEGRLAAIPIDVPALRSTSVTLVISASRTLSIAARAAIDRLTALMQQQS